MNTQKEKAIELKRKLYSVYGDTKIICSISADVMIYKILVI